MGNLINGKDIEKLLKEFKVKLTLELKETKDINIQAIYEDFEILSNIQEYLILSEIQEKNKDDNLKKRLNAIEKEVLNKYKIVKITGEEKSYYCKRGECYDSDGNIIDDCYEYYLEKDDIFCELPNDKIYEGMKNNLLKKINSKKKNNENYTDNYDEDYDNYGTSLSYKYEGDDDYNYD